MSDRARPHDCFRLSGHVHRIDLWPVIGSFGSLVFGMSAVIWGNFRRFLFWFSLLWLMADSSKTRFQNPLPHECSFYQAVSQSFNSSKFHFPQLWTESCQNSFGDESGRIRLLVVMTLTDSPFDRPLVRRPH